MKRIYPKAFLLLGGFPLIASAILGLLYVFLGSIISELNILSLNQELFINYHFLTLTIPSSFLIGLLYWNSRRITVRGNEVLIRTEVSNFKRSRIKIDEIIEICAHEKENNDASCKFHIHTPEEDIKVIEFWYDEKELLALAKEIKNRNPKTKVNRKLQAIMS